MRTLKKTVQIPSRFTGPFESLLAQFSAATLELNPSVGAPEFARRLTARASEMLGSRAAILALRGSGGWEIAAISGPAERWDAATRARVANALAEQSLAPNAVRSGAAARLLGHELAADLNWKEVALAPLKDSEGESLGMLCLVDLDRELSHTERQLLEALASHAAVALENAQLFSRVEQSRKQWVEDFDAISDFIIVHDSKDCVLRLNQALAEELGIRLTEAIGRKMGDLKILGTAQRAECSFCRDPHAEREEHIHTASERTYLVSTSRLCAHNENAFRTIHVLKDITDRREAERRYRRERDFNRNILNNTQSMILVLDTAGLISYANRRCFESGYREAELLGQLFTEIVASSHRSLVAESLDRALQGTPITNLEIPILRRNGAQGQFSISLSPMRDDQGVINSVVVVMTDVTDAADLQAKLMHTEKMAALGQLVSGVAHEVNNPLAAIVGFTDLLLENPEVPQSAKDELGVILQEAQRTRAIVQNLLSFARQMPAQRESVQINGILRQTVKLRAYDFSNHGVELREDYDEELPLALGDSHQLQQAFLNILNNAYDAVQETRRPGKIEIRTMHEKDRLEISFRDNGPGISHPDRIFDPFFTTKEVGKGTGLGLSICYGIVRAHRGEIIARNNPDGIGCTFTVRLPIAMNAAELLAAEASQ
ncbi:MAG TPA: PAS domain S-box protein [Candidatus Limnocylindrales bacterium]|nr:PAS domain S-box protein [Candidatus Limnocylindrales bacterium]